MGRNLWHRVLEANKKHIPLKRYSLEIRIDSVNKILRNKEKVKWTRNKGMLTRISDRNILCVFTHVYRIIKNWGPGPYNSLRHTDNRRCLSGLFLTRNRRGAHMFYLVREGGEFGYVLAEKKVTVSWLMNSNMVKFLVYHFTVPLTTKSC